MNQNVKGLFCFEGKKEGRMPWLFLYLIWALMKFMWKCKYTNRLNWILNSHILHSYSYLRLAGSVTLLTQVWPARMAGSALTTGRGCHQSMLQSELPDLEQLGQCHSRPLAGRAHHTHTYKLSLRLILILDPSEVQPNTKHCNLLFNNVSARNESITGCRN